MPAETKGPLTHKGSHDYELADPEQEAAWIKVENVSVHVLRTEHVVAVALYANGEEDYACLAGATLLFSEAKAVIEDCN